MAHTIVIYSTPTCHYCNLAKAFFKENNVTYTEHDVAQDLEKRQEMIDKSGQMGVPVIAIDDTEIIVGFNEALIREKLDMA